MKKATIYDVAREAGVSLATVSRVINGSSVVREKTKEKVMKALSEFLRPEFIARVDEIIVFHGLQQEDIVSIADLLLKELDGRLKEQKISLTVTDAAKKYLAEKGFDRIYGARPLRRTILTKVEDPLAEKLLEGDFTEGDHIVVDFQDEELTFHKKEAETTAAKE